MISHKEHFHGSDLEKIEKIYGIKKEEIISFSANVNPLGLSPLLKSTLSEHLDALTAYPDREYTALRQVIAKYCGDINYNHVMVGNGSTELISLIIRAVAPENAMVLGPTYSEYEHEITLCGGKCHNYILKEEDNFTPDANELCKQLSNASAEQFQLLVLCNPNNPTGSAFTTSELDTVLSFCSDNNIFVLIDETYIEFASSYDKYAAIPLTTKYSNLAVIRGISKFFAAPGLRLGYCVTSNTEIIDRIHSSQKAWSINSLAEVAGRIMFSDTDHIARTRKLMNTERQRMKEALDQIDGLKAYPTEANFILVKILQSNITADDVFDAAIKNRLMIRNCSTFESLDDSYFRFCFMNPEDNDRLINTIKKVMQSRTSSVQQ